MAGLTLLLETQKSRASSSKKSSGSSSPQVLNKADMVRLCRAVPPRRRGQAPPPAAAGFLEACFLCRKRLSPEKDIYMYRGDRGFCSVECRMRQMTMDEESVWMDNKCGISASTSTAAAGSSPSSSSGRHRKNGPSKPRPAGVVNAGFAY